MCKTKQKIMEEIQRKRELMIDCAQRHGFTNELTIQCSQELDILINEYQRTFQNSQQEQTLKIPRKKMMLIWPKTLLNA